MITELIFYPVFLLGKFVVGLFPQVSQSTGEIGQVFIDLLATGMYFFGKNTFLLITGSIVFWFTVGLSWSVIEWCYKKIPGVS